VAHLGRAGHQGFSPSQRLDAMKVEFLHWNAVAAWTWGVDDETCGICHCAFDGCCPDCKVPGDDCPIIWGVCDHAFHLHCILKWINSQQPRPQCPMCRRDWEFKGEGARSYNPPRSLGTGEGDSDGEVIGDEESIEGQGGVDG